MLNAVSANWILLELPYIAPGSAESVVCPSACITSKAYGRLRSTDLSQLKCPSDSYNAATNHFVVTERNGATVEFARGNYGINGGVSESSTEPGVAWDPMAHGSSMEVGGEGGGRYERIWGNGIAGFNKCFSLKDITRGQSDVVCIDELRAGLTTGDSRGVWALGEIGASATYGHGLIGDASGPNGRRPHADDVVGCNQSRELFGDEGLIEAGMPCCAYMPLSVQATSRSQHPGGVLVSVLDGATRFISDSIDPNVWHVMHCRDVGNEVISADCAPSHSSLSGKGGTEPVSDERPSRFANSVGSDFVLIHAGEFTMSVPDEGQDYNDPVTGVPPEAPPHRVRIGRNFYLGTTEITQAQYERVLGSSVNRTGPGPADAKDRQGDFPVGMVSWYEAVAYCCRLSELPAEKTLRRHYRLPTEAEWEFACRASDSQPFQPPSDRSSQERTGFNVSRVRGLGVPVKPVGSYPPNRWGLYDMRGNVWEWCSDWYAWDYYSHSPLDDPQGPPSGVLRVVRGSDWRFCGMGCKFTHFDAEPWKRNQFIGFRVACEYQ
jgi:formylglycine-generating enzyme required for sulfatase activity